MLPPVQTLESFQFAGTLNTGGLSTLFQLTESGSLQACYNSGGTWQWHLIGAPKDAQKLTVPVGCMHVGTTPYVFLIDEGGILWATYSDSITSKWTWQNISNQVIPALSSSAGVTSLGFSAQIVCLDRSGNLLTCTNMGGDWNWANLSEPDGAPQLAECVCIVGVGQTTMPAVFGITKDKTMWCCTLEGTSGKWSLVAPVV